MDVKEFLRGFIPTKIWGCCRTCFYRALVILARIKYMCYGKPIKDYHDIPIIINNYNRLEYLQILIGGLTKRGYYNIHIIDNNSTYPPLLQYYERCPYDVIKLERNVGFKAIWQTNVYKRFKRSFYVYTDSDLQIEDQCPEDFLNFFMRVIKTHPYCKKVGFSLRIDDIPAYNKNKDEVIRREKQFWGNKTEDGLYKASIDTTFALYRPFCKGWSNCRGEVFRTPEPYIVRHLPWYIDPNNLSEEDTYYINSGLIATEWSRKLINSKN